jgi:hypothetical protein
MPAYGWDAKDGQAISNSWGRQLILPVPRSACGSNPQDMLFHTEGSPDEAANREIPQFLCKYHCVLGGKNKGRCLRSPHSTTITSQSNIWHWPSEHWPPNLPGLISYHQYCPVLVKLNLRGEEVVRNEVEEECAGQDRILVSVLWH